MGTKISWTDAIWEVTGGCDKVSDGCQKCYALPYIARFAANPVCGDRYKGLVENNNWTGKIELFYDRIDQPLHWKNPRKVFVNPRSDLFHPEVNIGFLTHVFDTIEQCPQHIFQILTKRPEQALKMMWERDMDNGGWRYFAPGSFHPNIWLGTTCENQETADKRIPILLRIPAAVRFISAEPLLGEINLEETSVGQAIGVCDECGKMKGDSECGCCMGIPSLDQVIIGAESIGSHPGCECKIEWVRNIVRQCQAAGVAPYVKQIHMWRAGNMLCETEREAEMEAVIQLTGKKPKRVLVKDIELFPEDLRIREYPK